MLQVKIIEPEVTGILLINTHYFLFQLTNVPTTDTYPPSRIKDLTAELSIANVKFSFTAPGDDYDEGVGKNVFKTIRPSTKCPLSRPP